MSSWKFDAQHVMIVVAFLVGASWAGYNALSGQSVSVATVMPLALLMASHVFAFFKNPPTSPDQALSEGEGVAGKPGQRGFARMQAVLLVSIVGVIALAGGKSVGRTVNGLVSSQGCAAFQKAEPQVVTDLGAIAACVLTSVLGGATNAPAVAATCAPATLADVVQVVQALISYYESQGADGGAGAAPAPFKGIPATLTPQQLLTLKSFQGA